MTAKSEPRKTVKRVGRRWELGRSTGAKSSDEKVSYSCKNGNHGIQCPSLSCGCACH